MSDSKDAPASAESDVPIYLSGKAWVAMRFGAALRRSSRSNIFRNVSARQGCPLQNGDLAGVVQAVLHDAVQEVIEVVFAAGDDLL